MATCEPEQAPCGYRGFSFFDWAWSIFKGQCNVQSWLAGIFDSVSVAPFGNIAVSPSYAQVTSNAAVQRVTIPQGALSIQAVIDDQYAATDAITIIQDSGNKVLPLGADLIHPFISPVFTADVNGQNVTRGHGVYPQLVLQFPANSVGFVTATYRGPALPITVTTV